MSSDEKDIEFIKEKIPLEYFQEDFTLPDGFFAMNSELDINFETNAIVSRSNVQLNDHL